MKNIFKLMGIALLASSMILVSCKKDEENNENNNNNNEPTVTNGIKVTFGDVNWTAADILGEEYASYGLLSIGAFKDYESSVAPFVQGYLPNAVRSATHGQGDYYYFFYYENDNDVTIDDDGSLSGTAGAELPNWQPRQGFAENVTAIDMNAMTISATAEGTLFYLPDYINGVTTEKDINIVMTNAVWEPAEK